MAYAEGNPKTKKELKQRVADYVNGASADAAHPQPVRIFSPGPFGCKTDGEEFLEGPHYPKPHTWYAKVRVENGIVVKVLS